MEFPAQHQKRAQTRDGWAILCRPPPKLHRLPSPIHWGHCHVWKSGVVDVAVWDFKSAFHDSASGHWLLDVYVSSLDCHHPTCNRGQDAAACYWGRLGELGEEGEISITSWNLLIAHIPSASFLLCVPYLRSMGVGCIPYISVHRIIKFYC